MIEAEQYYRVLELEPGASPEEVHQGYLDLTWVWHPDRFTGHPRLQQKAHSKLQQLNEAHERLRSFRPTPQAREFHPKSKSQVSSPSYDQSPVKDLHKPEVKPAWRGDNQRTTKDRRHVGFNARNVDDWLD
jgi:hypothetical protein